METVKYEIQLELERLINAAYRVSADVGQQVEQALQDGSEHLLNEDEARSLLIKVVTKLKHEAELRGDDAAISSLAGDVKEIVENIIEGRKKSKRGTNGARPQLSEKDRRLHLVSWDGINPGTVLPAPWFHKKEVKMNCGFVKTTDINLWGENDRLDIHLGQFQQKHGRRPTSEELLSIMLGEMQLPGVDKEDQFEIAELADSISVNGVRRPPILDLDGTLLDGNRRVAACYYILNSDKFSSEQKRRVEYIFVWQLTEHATDSDRDVVVISLNFESDCKQKWPEYVKARKVYEEWQAMLAAEPRNPPSAERQRKMKQELSNKFALGRDASLVNRYLKMVDWAICFEEYHINENSKDTYEVKHRANECFQYFDELSKGTQAGSVAYELNQDDAFKHLVFDLLFQDKFKNWSLIRKLRYHDKDVRDALMRARDESDKAEAKEIVETCLTDAANRRRESRTVGANVRIENFVKWLKDLPISSFSNPQEIKPESLKLLLDALRLVERQASLVLEKEYSGV
jgi:hypothetical protein